MKLKTSYFNPTVLRKDITRFAPLWGIYSVCLLLYLLGLFTGKTASDVYARLIDSMLFLNCVNGVYGGLCAMFLFGDLFSPRRCNALHALPLRREGWFLTHTAAGLLFSLVPNLLFACLCCIRLSIYSYMAFIWLAVMLLQFLFFFGVAVFSAVCAGNRLGMLAICGIINYGSLLIALVANNLYLPMLEGLHLNFGLVVISVPLWTMMIPPVRIYDSAAWGDLLQQNSVSGIWSFLACYAAVGLVFAGLGLLVYRKRKTEYAGDFLALKILSPVFLVVYSLFVAIVLYLSGNLMGTAMGYVFLGIGLAVGFFTGRMFLERKVNVFKPKNFLKFGILAVAFALSLVLTWLDPLGVTQYVPDPEDIRSVRLFDDDTLHSVKLTKQEDLEAVTEAHRYLVQLADKDGSWNMSIRYTLKNGRVLERYYTIGAGGKAGQLLKPSFSRWEYIFNTDDWSSITDRVRAVSISNHSSTYDSLVVGDRKFLESGRYYANYHLDTGGDATLITELLKAVRRDCDEGNMAQLGDGSYIGYNTAEITLYFANGDTVSFQYSGKAVNTRPVVNDLFKQATPVTE